MTMGITLEEMLEWNEESSAYWKGHLDAHPGLLELPCDIGGVATVQAFVAHIWGVELRWAQRVAGLPVMSKEAAPVGPLEALFGLHSKAVEIYRGVLADPEWDWDAIVTLKYDWLPAQAQTSTRRKAMAHGLIHSQRHWAQLATLVRTAGGPAGFQGDLLFSLAIR
jgi:uncharacterized damage-inducible protein DinB